MPWAELRRWFSYAGVKMPQMGTTAEPSWVIFDDTPHVAKIWPSGPMLTWEDLEWSDPAHLQAAQDDSAEDGEDGEE